MPCSTHSVGRRRACLSFASSCRLSFRVGEALLCVTAIYDCLPAKHARQLGCQLRKEAGLLFFLDVLFRSGCCRGRNRRGDLAGCVAAFLGAALRRPPSPSDWPARCLAARKPPPGCATSPVWRRSPRTAEKSFPRRAAGRAGPAARQAHSRPVSSAVRSPSATRWNRAALPLACAIRVPGSTIVRPNP